MLNLSFRVSSYCGLVLAFTCLAFPKDLPAQSPPATFVVVTDVSDGEWVKRIGRHVVRVEVLFPPKHGEIDGNYQTCNARVRKLLNFDVLLVREAMSSPRQLIWRERMTAANPRGKVHSITQSRDSLTAAHDREMQLAIDVHGALVSVLPKQQAVLNANLILELQRLRVLHLTELATHD